MPPVSRLPPNLNEGYSPYHELDTQCTFPGCTRWFKGQVGLNQHISRSHAGKPRPVENPFPIVVDDDQSCNPPGRTNGLDPDPSTIDNWFEFTYENASWENLPTYLLESDAGLTSSGEDMDIDVESDVDTDAWYGTDSDVGAGSGIYQGSRASPSLFEAELQRVGPEFDMTRSIEDLISIPNFLEPFTFDEDRYRIPGDPSSPELDMSSDHAPLPTEGPQSRRLTPTEERSPSPILTSSDPKETPTDGSSRGFTRHYHDYLTGDICEPDDPPVDNTPSEWAPFESRLQFEAATFLYRREEMSAGNIDFLLKLWDISLTPHGDCAPFRNHKDLYRTIDSIPYGEIPWKSLSIRYPDDHKDEPKPSWMEERYVVWYRDPMEVLRELISNPDFKHEFDFVPYHDYGVDGHQFQDFMSGNWAWKQVDLIKNNPKIHARGAFLVPIIFGSDKTTVSVATGNNDYWPLYLSIGNIHNVTRRSHRNSVVVIGFLAIPKAEKEQRDTNAYRKFRRQLFHTSLTAIFASVRDAMIKPVKVKCNDGKYRRAIFSFGPYIADYPEQCLLTCVVQWWCPKCLASSKKLDNPNEPLILRCTRHTKLVAHDAELLHAWDTFGMITDVVPFTEFFPRADIYEMISPDILHQLIKGTFKDHLVTWIGEYLVLEYGRAEAKKIMDDVDRRIAIVPAFPNLRRFPQGRDFKQWTGNDSKALMKVYLPALQGYIPEDMTHALRALLEFSYFARQNSHNVKSLKDMEDALSEFHTYHEVFVETGVRNEDSWPPRQHSLKHYLRMIREFGSLNGLCSSITESKHIEAVKKPWRRSNRHDALGQMLVINTRSDKLRAAYNHFKSCGLLDDAFEVTDLMGDLITPPKEARRTVDRDDDGDGGPNDSADSVARGQPSIKLSVTVTARNLGLQEITTRLSVESFPDALLLYVSSICGLEHTSQATQSHIQLQLSYARFTIHPSAIATFYAPSDYAGVRGMLDERIRAVPAWRNGAGRYDTVFYRDDAESEAVTIAAGLKVGRVRMFFSFSLGSNHHNCALIHEFELVGSSRHENNTGMWIVEPQFRDSGLKLKVISLDQIFRAAHLIPVYGGRIPNHFNHTMTLDSFDQFFVNRFIDYHAFETAI